MKKTSLILIIFLFFSCNTNRINNSNYYTLTEVEECEVLNEIFSFRDTTELFSMSIKLMLESKIALANQYSSTLDIMIYTKDIEPYININILDSIYNLIISKNLIKKNVII